MQRPGVVRGEPVEAVTQLELWMADEPDVPVDTARSTLYTPVELYGHGPYADSLDGSAYAWSRRPRTRAATLARALHDHAIDLALESWTSGRHLVGVMGGHRLERGEAAYADAARLGAALGTDHVVATGGGPGAMEAANLGARFADRPDDLDAALAELAGAPSYDPSIDAWVRSAFDVIDRFGADEESLGIPTWHYGHEPPNVFATAIAKYFRNSTREATLLQVCDAGIVFLPGLGGTVQEIFQDACENYYATEEAVAPMVLVGAAYWTDELPAWPLLRTLARGRPMEGHVHLVDSLPDAVNLLVSGT
ncbi:MULTISPECIES: LOG family protein [unclassified Nocardioides]|uniref:LOG family protein n=1 Tax=unclassified Nocardioides TaxID=2615069 RepID=UPI001F157F64|nr:MULTISPECIES: Rossmann fold nucleotide-binding protein [unclassified Nocardioides]